MFHSLSFLFGQREISERGKKKKKKKPQNIVSQISLILKRNPPPNFRSGSRIRLSYGSLYTQPRLRPTKATLFQKVRGCLVCSFKQPFSVFKQHFTHFNTLFHPHVFPQIFSNNNFQFLNTYTKRALNLYPFLCSVNDLWTSYLEALDYF